MSQALAKVAPLKPEIRLGQAVSEFEAGLSTEQKVEFQALRLQSSKTAPNQKDVMRLTAQMDKSISNRYGGQCFGPRFTNFLQGVQQFAALGDILVGGSQNLIACGVWSVVRMSLLSFVSLSAYIDKLSSLFMAIGRTTPRYQGMALLYPHSKTLQSFLAEYFIVVVNICHHLFRFAQKSSIRQFTSSLSDAHLKTFQTDLDKWANSIKEEITLLEAQENSKSRVLTREMFKSHSHQRGYASKIRVLDFCSKYDHETAWKQTRKVGNSSFHKQPVEYQEWKDSSSSCTLVYTGKLGSGKSVLLANIVDDLNLSTEKDQSIVAYFFCRHDVRESLEARTIIGSLARQLLCTVPDLGVLAKRYENSHIQGDTEDLVQLLTKTFPKGRKAYLVLDGIDECNFQQKETLAKAIRKTQEKLHISVCVSFREEPNNDLDSMTEELLATRIVSLPKDNPDIEAFIETELERCLQRGLLTIGDPTLILEIQDALLRGAQGMFLWVVLQIKTLCDKKTDHAIREALANLPKSLSETFTRILEKSGTDLSLQAKTLQLVLAASRPLTTDELREALSVIPGDAVWDPSKLLHEVYPALACCGCLLAVDEEELTVRVIHHSVTQYLLAEHDGPNGTKPLLKEAQRTMADVIVTYLCYSVFGTELSKVKVHPVMAQSLPSKIVQATMGSSSNRRSLAIKFLKSRKQPSFDISKAIGNLNILPQPEKENSFSFFQYANAHFQESLFHVSGDNAAILRLTSKLIHSWASVLHIAQWDVWTACQLAVENRNEKVLGLLLQAGIIDISNTDETEEHILLRASRCGYQDLVEVIFNLENIDINLKDFSGFELLMRAVQGGHPGVVEAILKSEIFAVNPEDFRISVILGNAAYFGEKRIVELILESGKANINELSDGHTPLIGATRQRHKAVVEVIAKNREVDIDAKDPQNCSALMHAVILGYKEIVEVLIEVGKADVNTTEASKSTALMVAIATGHIDIAEFLLRTGKVDINAENNAGETAMSMAALNSDMPRLLESYGGRIGSHIKRG